ncbi:MAG: UDP-N-acetylmuramoyl-tripeptide--D-alanyl-D-alanine ligase [Acidobacteriota bacterium]|nr:UDP-N-acetylmuramoyl-tripeptide--D-alanyl-D-alanine ligase [Acidobacteriota bacterium]
MTSNEIARAVGGRVAGTWRVDPTGFSIDTRTLRRDDLYIAICGRRFDGHAFVAEAMTRGACGALVSDASALGGFPVAGVVVDDTLEALQSLARHIRRWSAAQLVAVTGSVGKTTTKELASAVLSARYRVFRNRGNLNNHIGLPLSLLELRTRPEVAVVELGMSGPGEISRLVGIAEPDVRVWTNVAAVHAEFFPSVDAIADAKAEILEGATSESGVVANAADPRVMSRLTTFPGRVTTFGVSVDADVMATEVEDLGLRGSRACLQTPVGATPVTTSLLGRGNVANVAAAVGVGLQLGVAPDDAAERIGSVQALPHRGSVHHLSSGVVVVDDSYNSSPPALDAALTTLSRERSGGRRVAVLGEMLELGDQAVSFHRAAGRAAAAAELGLLLTVGGTGARELGASAIEAGLDMTAVAHYESSDELAAEICSIVRDDDVILIKGSRGIRTDVVASRLTAGCQ